jgi:eukaryotic-like serine/threonine-protein kinase
MTKRARRKQELAPTAPGQATTITRSGIGRRVTPWTLITPSWRPAVAGLIALLAALGVVGLWGHSQIERAVKEQTAARLQATLGAAATGVQEWLESNERLVEIAAADERLQRAAFCPDASAADQRPCNAGQIEAIVSPYLRAGSFEDFYLVDARGRLVAGGLHGPAKSLPRGLSERLAPLLEPAPGGRPERARLVQGLLVAPDQPLLAIAAALPERAGILVFALRQELFTRILRSARGGESGETYAVDRAGRLLSESRFVAQLREIGLLPATAESAVLSLDIRDPGGDLTDGHRTGTLRREQPLTRMAKDLVAGHAGYDVDGYRDYRGVPVVGAWRWLETQGIGVANEVDAAEAFRPLASVRRVYYGMLGLLGAALTALLAASVVLARWRRRVQRAEGRATQLGQYQIVRRLGEGGMGVVYLAQHALLKRPTAIKVVRSDQATKETLARFEREVKLTSELSHPNTVAVYDYGRTDDGTFFYAMEYLEGLDLETLISRFGPLPSARIIHFLRQACGSLAEAHAAGIVHRDIKPGNLFSCQRGGVHDVIKVLDFGIVKLLSEPRLTRASSVLGTPEYMSPEMFEKASEVGPRSDLYSLGATAYYLATGEPVFDVQTVAELCAAHLSRKPLPPSERLGRAVDPTLEAVILSCLAKDPRARPQGADQLSALLQRSPEAHAWSQEQARAWWAEHPLPSPPASV